MKKRILLVHILGLAVLFGVCPYPSQAFGQTDGPISSPSSSGKILPRADSQEARTLLAAQKFVVTPRTFHQIYEPYLNSPVPVFITADALLGAYQVLRMESLRQFEQRGEERLREELKGIWTRIAAREKAARGIEATPPAGAPEERRNRQNGDYYTALKEAARQRARLVVAVALTLLGEEPADLDERLRQTVSTEVERIRRAQQKLLPEWAGEPDGLFKELDYRQFEFPPGERESPPADDYFKALRWLQTVPFRIEKDDELLSILWLGKVSVSTQGGGQIGRSRIHGYFRCRRDLNGRERDRDLVMAARIMQDRPADLDRVRQFLYADNAGLSEDRQAGSFFIVAPEFLPHAALFRQTTALAGRRWPAGLEICALLGSENAARHLTERIPEGLRAPLLDAIRRSRAENPEEGLAGLYFRCLSSLFAETEPGAPAFMLRQPWREKLCNTALSGWVQYFDRQAPLTGQGEEVTGPAQTGAAAAGFVEPIPEFYALLGDLVELAGGNFQRCNTFPSPRQIVAADLLELARQVSEGRYLPQNDPGKAEPAKEADIATQRARVIFSTLARIPFADVFKNTDRMVASERLAELADGIKNGDFDDDPVFQALVLELNLDAKQRWLSLRDICRRMEVLAHKQLRGVTFNRRDNFFIADFGLRLAAVMGQADLMPKDNAPAIIVLHRSGNSGEILYGATGRPRQLLLLYPHDGKEVLCRGAVLPYYELVSTEGLNRRRWLQRLDSDERPRPPRWSRQMYAPGRP